MVAVRQTRPALPTYLPAPGPAEESEDDDEDVGDYVVKRRRDSLEFDGCDKTGETECSDSDGSYR